MRKILKIELTGDSDALHNVVGIVMRNERVDLTALRYESEPPPQNLVGKTRSAQKNKDPRLVYVSGSQGKMTIDIDASLRNMGLTKEQLMTNAWRNGSGEHSLKRSIVLRERNKQ